MGVDVEEVNVGGVEGVEEGRERGGGCGVG